MMVLIYYIQNTLIQHYRTLFISVFLPAAIAATTLLLSSSLFGNNALAKSDKVIIRLGTVAPKGTPWEKQMKRTRKHVAKASGDGVKMKVFFGGAKGDEKSLVRQCRDARLEMVAVSSAALSSEVPPLQVLELPFLFDSNEEADFVLDNYLYEPVAKVLNKYGFVLYQWAENGWQNFALKDRFVKSVNDLAGRKMRSQESPVHIASWKAFGASPVEMAVSEVLPALKTGLVDGFAQTPLFTFAAGWQQGIKYYTVSHHVYQPALMVYSKKFFEAQSAELKKALMVNIDSDTKKGRRDVRSIEAGLMKNFELSNIAVYTLTKEERKAFAKAAEPVFKNIQKNGSKEAKTILNAILKGKAAYKKSHL